MRTLKKQEKSSSGEDPLAYLAQSVKSQAYTHASPQSTSSFLPQALQQQTPLPLEEALLASMNQILNLLSGFQK